MGRGAQAELQQRKGSIGASTPLKGFGFSWVSVCVAETMTLPLDTVKTRMQLQGELGVRATTPPFAARPPTAPPAQAKRVYNTAPEAFVAIARSEGAAGLFKGLPPALIRQSLYGTFRYGAYTPLVRMAGVRPGCDFPIARKVAAACAAGSIGSFIAVPCDLVKVRLQADRAGTRYAGTLSAFREIARADGVRGLWTGATPTIARAAVGAMTELPVYDEIKSRLLQGGHVEEGFGAHVTSALCAGLFSTFCMNPFDVAKSRLMNQAGSRYSGLLDCLAKTTRAEGVRSLWKGFWPAYMRIGPRVVIIFVVLEQLRARFDS